MMDHKFLIITLLLITDICTSEAIQLSIFCMVFVLLMYVCLSFNEVNGGIPRQKTLHKVVVRNFSRNQQVALLRSKQAVVLHRPKQKSLARQSMHDKKMFVSTDSPVKVPSKPKLSAHLNLHKRRKTVITTRKTLLKPDTAHGENGRTGPFNENEITSYQSEQEIYFSLGNETGTKIAREKNVRSITSKQRVEREQSSKSQVMSKAKTGDSCLMPKSMSGKELLAMNLLKHHPEYGKIKDLCSKMVKPLVWSVPDNAVKLNGSRQTFAPFSEQKEEAVSQGDQDKKLTSDQLMHYKKPCPNQTQDTCSNKSGDAHALCPYCKFIIESVVPKPELRSHCECQSTACGRSNWHIDQPVYLPRSRLPQKATPLYMDSRGHICSSTSPMPPQYECENKETTSEFSLEIACFWDESSA